MDPKGQRVDLEEEVEEELGPKGRDLHLPGRPFLPSPWKGQPAPGRKQS